MDSFPILKIEYVFQFGTGSIIVLPGFPVIDGLTLPMDVDACVIDEHASVRCKLRLMMTHLNIPTTTDVSKRWRITCELREIDRQDVVVSATLVVFDRDLAAALNGSAA